ncbi:MAG: isopentenyl-diphosphate Delta-isomerase [Pseudanabaena sp.]|jgi:isopentenyl-diphosphate delta-isomerase|nr:isopentenyl-diphosphate Delta-isomerase [Pseudanabaena sp. M090S1SP2A07QC]MCA6562087.1 isopentenyl-diphosphate Delta-isomerase [Pseudanabaena sp. M079S1SP2A07QC]MCA6574274.1 isopentenyl-diphosphate Delta-isomerase [Pseudanabaena sp. M53BS1SP1A06MG]MCA6581983.1 isopentenyl-diphosphate Delta-isomerase [Pseudanabaena sp. M34BS1SP1A06MG]MCA6591229.1 isopentenyl-diphosphate Delta-isomerase [Pseudanabaena sp. M38BS1SP1A06MG]MCA6602044.1 isopentenyl-diphosphate Delta-isomerase [Pseudanabaena sp. M
MNTVSSTAQLDHKLEEKIILVDTSDRQIGTAEKLQAHRDGLLHRAFSIFVLNSQDQLLLQKRAKHKYHSGGLWTNTCCSHPRDEEPNLIAAHRRLQEEMGFDCELQELFSFVYRAELDHNLIEYEFDHVFVGYSDREPVLNPEEAEDWKWIDLAVLQADIRKHPETYTYWLRDCCDRLVAALK